MERDMLRDKCERRSENNRWEIDAQENDVCWWNVVPLRTYVPPDGGAFHNFRTVLQRPPVQEYTSKDDLHQRKYPSPANSLEHPG